MQQEELINFLNIELKNKRLSHAYLFSCDSQEVLDKISNDFVRSIFCKNNAISCDNCVFCNKFNNKNIISFITIDAEKNLISKSKIDNLILSFSTSTLEENCNKVYVIRNCENLTNNAANALIKFLEEPPSNTFAILLNKGKEKVIETIISRCKRVYINIDEIKNEELELTNLIENNDVDELCLYSLKLMSYNREKVIKILNNTYNYMLLKGNKIAITFLETIDFVKKNNLYLLALDTLMIKIIREIQ